MVCEGTSEEEHNALVKRVNNDSHNTRATNHDVRKLSSDFGL
jgi:hypothetical protein